MASPTFLSSPLPRRQDLEALRVGDEVDGGLCKGLGADQEVKGGIEAGDWEAEPKLGFSTFLQPQAIRGADGPNRRPAGRCSMGVGLWMTNDHRHTHPQMEEAWEGILQGRVRTGPRGQTCDDDLSPCSSGPSPADCGALVRAFFGLGGPRDLPAAVP